MKCIIWTAIFFMVCSPIVKSQQSEVTYVGAVLEYAPYDLWTENGTGHEVIVTNANTIVSYAEQAKYQYADIFVAPEYGIQSLNMKRPDVDELLTFTQNVPRPADKIVPCYLPDNATRIDAVRILSCAADELDMYLVIDLAEFTSCNDTKFDSEVIYWQADEYENCTENGYYAYNTQVVFDRSGTVIARYRKQHLFLEDQFTPGPMDNSEALFLTDFNVLFSLQICFDIVYESPGYYNVKNAGVKDVVMSTAWVDELPFHLADGIQNGWSKGLETNLLVSGYHNPFKSKVGSGIYRAYAGEEPIYVYDKDLANVLLVGTVTTKAFSSSNIEQKFQSNKHPYMPIAIKSQMVFESTSDSSQHTILNLNMVNFTTQFLPPLDPGVVSSTTLCSENFFCCDLSYEYSGSLNYAFTVFSGRITEGSGRYALGLQTCGIVYCKNGDDTSSCGKLNVVQPESDLFGPYEVTSTSFSAIDIYPIGLHRDYSVIDMNELVFENDQTLHTLYTTSATKNHLSSALYGRWYANDP